MGVSLKQQRVSENLGIITYFGNCYIFYCPAFCKFAIGYNLQFLASL